MRTKVFMSQVLVMLITLLVLASCGVQTNSRNYSGVKQGGKTLRTYERPQCVNNW